MAQYAILIYAADSVHAPDATPEDTAPEDTTPEDTATCDQHSEGLQETGTMVTAYALTPRTMATSIHDDVITDGPFIDSKEIVAGFYVIEAPDLDAALAVARANPAARDGGAVEIRPVAGSFVRDSPGSA